MRITNQNISFNKAIRVVAYPYASKKKITQDAVEIARNRVPADYNKQQAGKIKEFLDKIFPDSSREEGGIFSRVVDFDTYIFSGEEAIEARKIIADSKQERDDLEEYYLTANPSEMDSTERIKFKSETLKEIERHNIGIRRDKKLLALAGSSFYRRDLWIDAENGAISEISCGRDILEV